MTTVVPPVPGPALPADRSAEVLARDAWRAAVAALTGPAGTWWALLLVDVDRFADMTARHGRPAVDAVLTGIAATLRAVGSRGAVVGRSGGDEIVALLPRADRSAALRTADL